MRDRIEDRRGAKRRHLLYYLDVLDEENGSLIGQLGDITRDGILIISADTFDMEQDRTLRVRVPGVREFSSGDIVSRCSPCWESPDLNPDLHCTGYRFVDPDEKLQKKVDQLIDLLGFRD